ncbi:MAG TPA: recombinase family protein [Azospirillaceae bacterium]|nr:recombinase family protein [Azospirillaceae bacterium]
MVEQRGEKQKKVLEINPAEAAAVRTMFAWVLRGEPGQAPMGIKMIAATLNSRGISLRGRPFSVGLVHRLLTRESYVGRHYFNMVNSRTRERKPASEWISLPVPPIVSEEDFAKVGAILSARNPRVTPPRVVSGTTLLTGLATCGWCGGGLTIRTGKSGRYRY